LIGIIFAKAKIDIKNLRDPLPRAAYDAVVQEVTRAFLDRGMLFCYFSAKEKSRESFAGTKKVTKVYDFGTIRLLALKGVQYENRTYIV